MIGFVLLGLVIAFVVGNSMTLQAHSCNVCMEYKGRSKCREVAAATIDGAREGAVLNACAFISSGMRDSMECQRTRPATEVCQ